MAERQSATPPGWLHRSRWRLLIDAIGGLRQNRDKLVQLFGLLWAFVRPSIVRQRLERLHSLGHIDVVPTTAQLLLAARDQMMLSASEETRIFYRSQGIPWIFHNLRRFLAGPATMMDPMGLFSPRETVVHHVLQTFHRHPVYDLVLLRAYPGGLEAMAEQALQIRDGTHPHQRVLASLIEDGAYHGRLYDDIRAFAADPYLPARPVPDGLVADAGLMLGMDQFKDIRGYTRYAARLHASAIQVVGAWLGVAWNEVIGRGVGLPIGPRAIDPDCCDPDIRARHVGSD